MTTGPELPFSSPEAQPREEITCRSYDEYVNELAGRMVLPPKEAVQPPDKVFPLALAALVEKPNNTRIEYTRYTPERFGISSDIKAPSSIKEIVSASKTLQLAYLAETEARLKAVARSGYAPGRLADIKLNQEIKKVHQLAERALRGEKLFGDKTKVAKAIGAATVILTACTTGIEINPVLPPPTQPVAGEQTSTLPGPLETSTPFPDGTSLETDIDVTPGLTPTPPETPGACALSAEQMTQKLFDQGIGEKEGSAPLITEAGLAEVFGTDQVEAVAGGITAGIDLMTAKLIQMGKKNIEIPKFAEGLAQKHGGNGITIDIKENRDDPRPEGFVSIEAFAFASGGYGIFVRDEEGDWKAVLPNEDSPLSDWIFFPDPQGNVHITDLPAWNYWGELKWVKLDGCPWTAVQVNPEGQVLTVLNPEGKVNDINSVWKTNGEVVSAWNYAKEPPILSAQNARYESFGNRGRLVFNNEGKTYYIEVPAIDNVIDFSGHPVQGELKIEADIPQRLYSFQPLITLKDESKEIYAWFDTRQGEWVQRFETVFTRDDYLEPLPERDWLWIEPEMGFEYYEKASEYDLVDHYINFSGKAVRVFTEKVWFPAKEDFGEVTWLEMTYGNREHTVNILLFGNEEYTKYIPGSPQCVLTSLGNDNYYGPRNWPFEFVYSETEILEALKQGLLIEVLLTLHNKSWLDSYLSDIGAYLSLGSIQRGLYLEANYFKEQRGFVRTLIKDRLNDKELAALDASLAEYEPIEDAARFGYGVIWIVLDKTSD